MSSHVPPAISIPAVEAVEQRAERVLAEVPPWIWDGESLPVPVADIADSCFGLLLREVEDLSAAGGVPALRDGQSFSGLLLPDAREIWVNAGEATRWPTRRRFTIGHELGHFCLHHHHGEAVWCRTACVEEELRAPERPALPPAEEEANAFAAALLMPAGLIRKHYRKNMDFFGFCDLFGASGSAMGRRLHAVV